MMTTDENTNSKRPAVSFDLEKAFVILARSLLLCLGLFAAMLQGSAAAVHDEDDLLFGPQDVFDLEVAVDPQLSPDSKSVIYVRETSDVMSDRWRSSIWIAATNGSDHHAVLSDEIDYMSPRWSPSGKQIAFLAAHGDGRTALHVRWMDSGETALLASFTQTPEHLSWSADGAYIAFSMFAPEEEVTFVQTMSPPEGAEWAPRVSMTQDPLFRIDGVGKLRGGNQHLFVIPSEGGVLRRLTSGTFNHAGPLSWTPDGRELLFAANRNDDWKWDSEERDIWAVDVESKRLRRLTNRAGPDFNPAVSPNCEKIAYLGYDDEKMGFHTATVTVMNLDGSDKQVVPEAGFDRSVDAVAWSGNSELIIQYDDHGKTTLAHLGLSGNVRPITHDLGGVGVGRPYTSGAFSVSADMIAYTQGTAERPSDIAVLKRGRGARRLTRLNDDLLTHKKLATVEAIRWKSSADGREIQGWIVKPPAFNPDTVYPLILEIHGGPFGAYGPHFSAEIQRYAAAGYVVLFANPRGSTSYGNEFANLIHHQYPGQDYDDLMSGVDAVLDLGFVDKDNLFVTGGSGGGLLTAWIVGKTDRFSAAVSAKPVINMISFALTSDYANYFYQYWFEKPPWEDPETYWSRSPLSLVGNVQTPTMLISGENDLRTPMSEAEQFYHALRLRGVDAALVSVPEAYHFIAARPSHLNAKVDHVLAWFERYREDRQGGD